MRDEQHRFQGDSELEHQPERVEQLPTSPGKQSLTSRLSGGVSDDVSAMHAAADRGVSAGAQAMPFLGTIQRSFGDHDIGGVRAHTGGRAAEACDELGAVAYASGNQVAFRAAPDLHTAAHEATHVIQQRSGVALKDGVGREGDAYERQADAVADAVVAGESAAPMLDGFAGSGASAGPIQRKVQLKAAGPTAGPGPASGDKKTAGAISMESFSHWVQSAINKLDAKHGLISKPLEVDGKYGGLSRAGVRSFQRKVKTISSSARDLAVDGIVGPNTTGALERASGSKNPSGRKSSASPQTATPSGSGATPGTFSTPTSNADATTGGSKAPPKSLPVGTPIRKVYTAGTAKVGFQKCLVYVSPGGLTSVTPDVFMFFHGYSANYGVDDAQKNKKGLTVGERRRRPGDDPSSRQESRMHSASGRCRTGSEESQQPRRPYESAKGRPADVHRSNSRQRCTRPRRQGVVAGAHLASRP